MMERKPIDNMTEEEIDDEIYLRMAMLSGPDYTRENKANLLDALRAAKVSERAFEEAILQGGE